MPSISFYLFATLAIGILGAMLKTTSTVLAGQHEPTRLHRALHVAGLGCLLLAAGFAGALVVFLIAWKDGFLGWYP